MAVWLGLHLTKRMIDALAGSAAGQVSAEHRATLVGLEHRGLADGIEEGVDPAAGYFAALTAKGLKAAEWARAR